MKNSLLWSVLAAGLALLGGCRGCDRIQKVNPGIGVLPATLDFQKVKLGEVAERVLTVSAQSKAALLVTAVTLEGPGAAAFSVVEPPTSVAELANAPLKVRFAPGAVQAYAAEVVIESNDPDRPVTRVPLLGEGAMPIITVTPDCQVARKCSGVATVSPPEIDFGTEPLSRLLPIPVTSLPSLSIVNDGEVSLTLSQLGIEGADAAAFNFTANVGMPTGGMLLDPGNGFNASIRFKPTSKSQATYQAEVVIGSDDPTRPEVRVKLKGALRPNEPPRVCANILRVKPGDGSAPLSWMTKADWDPLLIPPASGYDFRASRDVQPKSDITFSALSDSADQTTCSFDPEDGRQGLVYLWELVASPAGASPPALGVVASSQATLQPVATGEYTVRLTVKDSQGASTSTTLLFLVAIKEDLVAQLSWTGFSEVDLDLHLVRPSAVQAPTDPFSGAFAFFDEGAAHNVSGDLNGFSATTQKNNAGFNFDWGEPGTSDDPRLNLDDRGSGALVENVSLNYPEHDARCDGGPCTYKVMVHYFNDGRPASGASCTVAPTCKDGEPCDCEAGKRCVANDAPISAAPSGAGKCYLAPAPVVRIFVRANPTPLKVIPLEGLVPPDPLVLPAPCQMLYVADVVWPERGAPTDGGTLLDGGTAQPQVVVKGADASGRIVAPLVARFGYRQQDSRQCSPNAKSSGLDWYVPAP